MALKRQIATDAESANAIIQEIQFAKEVGTLGLIRHGVWKGYLGDSYSRRFFKRMVSA
jgi:hypothetical protein